MSHVAYAFDTDHHLITALDIEFCDKKDFEAKELLWKVSGDGIQFVIQTEFPNSTRRYVDYKSIVDRWLRKLDQESKLRLFVHRPDGFRHI